MVFWWTGSGRWAVLGFGMALLLGAGLGICLAQEAPKPAVNPPQNQQPAPAQQPVPQPGAGAQVRTGSVIGNGNDQGFMSRLLALLGDHQFLEMEKLLQGSDESTGGDTLPAEQKQLIRGVLANRENQPQESIQLLEPLVDRISAGGDAAQEKLLRKTLAEDYLRAGEMAKAAKAYQEYDARLGSSLTPDERDEIELPLKLLPLAAANPTMTLEAGAPFEMPYNRDAIGLTDISVFVDAQSHDWMLDPTAPFNLICRSTARSVGLKVSTESAIVHTVTGRAMEVHATVIPRFTLGTVTFRNMTAFVFEDADYYFPVSRYQVRGVLGYPAVSALGSLTVVENSHIEVQPGPRGDRLTTGARFFLDGDQVIAALGKPDDPGDERMFVVDAGGQQTYLSSRYFAEHSSDFAGKEMQVFRVPGSENKPPAAAYVADAVTLMVGDTPVKLHYTQVLIQPLGNAAVDDTYGKLGVDVLDELKSYTFDYRTMRFGVRQE